MKKIILLAIVLVSFSLSGQKIILDPGHGYNSRGQCENRMEIECQTALAVGLYTKSIFDRECPSGASVKLTRPTDAWISIGARYRMSNSWGADRFISIHTNGGGGTGTESFYCYLPDNNSTPDRAFANLVQANMVRYGEWRNRRVVEDKTFGQRIHFGVLRGSYATSTLSEIGFGDNPRDAAKLRDATWRQKFARSYYVSLVSSMGLRCSPSQGNAPGAFNINSGTSACYDSNNYNRITWSASSGATSYQIYRNNALYYTVPGSQTAFTNWVVNAGTSYNYTVKAVNSAGGTWNANGARSVATTSCSSTSVGPFTLSGAARCTNGNNYNQLTWTAAANATSYQVYRNNALYDNATSNLHYENYWIGSGGTTYNYKVKGMNSTSSQYNSNGTVAVTAVRCLSVRDNDTRSIEEIGVGDYYNFPLVSVSPNPASKVLNVKLPNLKMGSDANIQIVDISGNIVMTNNSRAKGSDLDANLDISSLKPGYYTLVLEANDETYTTQFLKQ